MTKPKTKNVYFVTLKTNYKTRSFESQKLWSLLSVQIFHLQLLKVRIRYLKRMI